MAQAAEVLGDDPAPATKLAFLVLALSHAGGTARATPSDRASSVLNCMQNTPKAAVDSLTIERI